MGERISITRALSEIKLLEKKINQSINELQPTQVITGNKPPVGYETLDKFKLEKKSKYQSINDLIERRSQIKRKVVLSNATTMIDVAGKHLSVAECIDYKTSVLSFKVALRNMLANSYNSSANQYETQLNNVKDQIDKQLLVFYGRDKKISDDERNAIVDPYMKTNAPKVVDPIGCVDEYEKLTKEIDDFTLDVDRILAESNATTFIEID